MHVHPPAHGDRNAARTRCAVSRVRPHPHARQKSKAPRRPRYSNKAVCPCSLRPSWNLLLMLLPSPSSSELLPESRPLRRRRSMAPASTRAFLPARAIPEPHLPSRSLPCPLQHLLVVPVVADCHGLLRSTPSRAASRSSAHPFDTPSGRRSRIDKSRCWILCARSRTPRPTRLPSALSLLLASVRCSRPPCPVSDPRHRPMPSSSGFTTSIAFRLASTHNAMRPCAWLRSSRTSSPRPGRSKVKTTAPNGRSTPHTPRATRALMWHMSMVSPPSVHVTAPFDVIRGVSARRPRPSINGRV
jgi:hypothetical protein